MIRIRSAPLRALGIFSATLALGGCSREGATPGEGELEAAVLEATIPPDLAAGEAAFDANCAACHGARALGTEAGPPLVHIIYETSHHGDLAFIMAAERGVRAHHWNFGDMAPVPSVSRDELQEIIAYVRFLQRQVGIS